MAGQKAMGKTVEGAVRFLCRRAVLIRNLTIAAVVGLILSGVNQGDVLMSGDLSASVWIKVLFNFAVPFTVASVSAVVHRPKP